MIRNIEIKKLDNAAEIPGYGTVDSAGVDLVACIKENIEIGPLKTAMIPTGLSINMQEVVEDCVALIFPRSGKGAKEGKVLGNLTGVIDKDYQGEIKVSIWNRNPERYILVQPGEKIAQMVFLPIIKANFVEVSEFSSSTERGAGGFGSTGS